MLVLAIAAAGITALQGNLFTGQSSIKDLQVRSRLMLECAEQVIAVRHFTPDGYNDGVTTTSFGTNLCGGVPALAGFAIPSVTITDPYTGTACPANGTCKTVSITQNGLTPLTLLLVDY